MRRPETERVGTESLAPESLEGGFPANFLMGSAEVSSGRAHACTYSPNENPSPR